MSFRASFKEIGSTAMVPLSVPVALFGKSEAIGFGWSTVMQVSSTVRGEDIKYVEDAYRRASNDRKESAKKCRPDDFEYILGRRIVKKARIGCERRAMSR